MRRKTWLDWTEWLIAVTLGVIAIFLHWRLLWHAGPLWRDEVASINLASAPTPAQFWRDLQLDNFPVLYFGVVRGWSMLGFAQSDFLLRWLGFLLGLVALGTWWIVCWQIDRRPPLWPLALTGVAALTFQCGDQLRPYGLSAILLLLSFAAFWKVAFAVKPARQPVLIAALAATFAVQASFTNSIFILALGLTSAAIAFSRNGPRAIINPLAAGAVAAASLLPYLLNFAETHRWLALMPGAPSFSAIFQVLHGTLTLNHFVMPWVWMALFGFGLIAAVVKPRVAQIAFPALALLLATSMTLIFFRVLRWQTHPRYFFLLLLFGAICFHCLLQNFARQTWHRVVQLILIIVVAGLQIPWAYGDSGVRLTNVDAIAEALASRAKANDLILLTGFWSGLSFHRYFHGPTKWMTLPEINDLNVYRWDLVMQEMAKDDPLQNILQQIEVTLRAGGSVYLVGSIAMQIPAQEPPRLEPAPQSIYGWELQPYMTNLQMRLGFFLQQHAGRGRLIPVEIAQPIYGLENLGLFEVTGWREKPR